MRELKRIIVHCSATKPSMDIGASEIRKWHKAKGWSDIGYHYVIRRDGRVEDGRPVVTPGAHVKGHNADSIGICLVGGVDKKGKPDANFSIDQYQELETLVFRLRVKYGQMPVSGHRDFTNKKACPCFNVKQLLK